MNSMFTKIVRLALGLALVVFGANMIHHFIPMDQPDGTTAAGQFMNSLGATGYIFPVVGALEVLIGVMLLLKKWVAFALILLAPISINILLFHLFLDIPGLSVALLVMVFNTILIFKHWQQYKPLFY
ncbi:DoxX protein [Flavobacterium sp. N1994]|uniref:DoxX protein n=1 Tax=Flavobacterium sp. N1994 TaxID=2986827 RepID=UPI002221F828|nr:DoxX protein [Flavobacterium sp. N1994]